MVAEAIAAYAPCEYTPDVLAFLKDDGEPSYWEMAWALFNGGDEKGALKVLTTALAKRYAEDVKAPRQGEDR